MPRIRRSTSRVETPHVIRLGEVGGKLLGAYRVPDARRLGPVAGVAHLVERTESQRGRRPTRCHDRLQGALPAVVRGAVPAPEVHLQRRRRGAGAGPAPNDSPSARFTRARSETEPASRAPLRARDRAPCPTSSIARACTRATSSSDAVAKSGGTIELKGSGNSYVARRCRRRELDFGSAQSERLVSRC